MDQSKNGFTRIKKKQTRYHVKINKPDIILRYDAVFRRNTKIQEMKKKNREKHKEEEGTERIKI